MPVTSRQIRIVFIISALAITSGALYRLIAYRQWGTMGLLPVLFIIYLGLRRIDHFER